MVNSLVSICIPVYNGEKYLSQCIESACSQTYHNIEVLIVDDRSTDNSIKIAESYAERDARIRIIKNKNNLGLVPNWNKSIELAQGEWIKFLFQDDLLPENSIERLLLNADEDINFIISNRDFLFEEDVSISLRSFYQYDLVTLDAIGAEAGFITASAFCKLAEPRYDVNFIGEPTNTMFRRRIVFEVGVFNVALIQLCDWEYWIRLASNYGLLYIPDTLAHFRVHGKSASSENHRRHSFRLSHLDPIILLHDLCFMPYYYSFRSALKSNEVLKEKLEKRIDAIDQALGENDSNSSVWEQILERYPLLQKIKTDVKKRFNLLSKMAYLLRK